MSPTDNNNLFITNPVEDLATLIGQAKNLNASRLLLLAGKYPVCRIANELSPPLTNERLHFSQTEKLASALLNGREIADLDKEGAVEVRLQIQRAIYSCSIFYGNGSHNIIVFLNEETR